MSNERTRREFLRIAVAGFVGACGTRRPDGFVGEDATATALPPHLEALSLPRNGEAERVPLSNDFPLGVASGDVHADGAVVWTRHADASALRLRAWEMAGDTYARRVVDAPVQPAEGGYVHVELRGLKPGAHYRYAFFQERDGELVARSDIGRFRAALPDDSSEPIVLGAVSCTDHDVVPEPLARAAERDDLAAFLLLGDTSYNDGCFTLDQYRERWAKSLGRDAYRALRRSTSVLATWDDHEVTNDFNPETIDPERLATARRAFFEALPLRRLPEAPNRLWHSVRWGRTAEIFVLDSRSERKPSTLLTGEHQYLSPAQLTWLKEALASSPATFKVVMSSVPISDFGFSALSPDGWRAYQRQRLELLRFVEDRRIGGVLWVAGDHHFASVGRVSPSGPGSSALEALAGPGAQGANPLYRQLVGPQWDFASGVNNYLAIHLDPASRRARLAFHDGAGKVIFDRAYTL